MSVNQLDLAKFSDKARSLIAFALQAGFTATQGKTGGAVSLHAPNVRKTLVIGAVRQFNDAKAKSLYEQIRRYGDPLKVAEMEAVVMDGVLPSRRTFDLIDGAMNADHIEAPAPPPKEKRRPALPQPHEIVEAVVAREPAKPHIVSQGPRKTRQGSKTVYDSDAVIERLWSDGHVDWACAWEGCDYTADNHKSVSTHYARSKTHQVVPKPLTWVDPTLEPSGVHRDTTQRRIEKLAEEIGLAFQHAKEVGGPLMPEDLAEFIITRRKEHEAEHEHRGPLTDAEVLERIRRLVDTGQYIQVRDENAELRAKIEDFTETSLQALERITELEAERDTAVAKAKKAADTLRAFRELAAEEVD